MRVIITPSSLDSLRINLKNMYEELAKHIIWQAITTIIMCGALFEVYPDLVLEEMIKQLHSLSCFLRVLSTNTDLLYLDMTRRIKSKDYSFP